MLEFEQEDIEKLKTVLDEFTKKYKLSVSDVLRIFESKDYFPISVFNVKLSPFETIVKFLRQNQGKTFKEISKLLNKDVSAAWMAHRNAMKKLPKRFDCLPSKYDVPIKELHSKKLSLLEIICQYLKEKCNLSFREIGKILDRNERTVWTAYNRAKKKMKNE